MWIGMEKNNLVPADTVIVAVGMQANVDEAFALSGSEYQSFCIGDCVKAGNIQKAQRSAFGIATSI